MLGFEGENAREKVIVLLTMCFALAMAMLDNTVVNIALPAIGDDLGAGTVDHLAMLAMDSILERGRKVRERMEEQLREGFEPPGGG